VGQGHTRCVLGLHAIYRGPSRAGHRASRELTPASQLEARSHRGLESSSRDLSSGRRREGAAKAKKEGMCPLSSKDSRTILCPQRAPKPRASPPTIKM
jgi:hypothetical protein